PSRLVLSALAVAYCYLGDAAAATASVEQLGQRPEFGFARPEQEFGRAWALVARGDLPGARAALQDAATPARTPGYSICEAPALHDIARLGDSRSVHRRLGELADLCEGALVDTYARRAAASVAADGQGLVQAVDQFEHIGARLLAAETAMEAAHAYRAKGES